MGLVDYSDSDASESEQAPTTKPFANSSKPAFQKVVDRSNPGKIRVSLPQAMLEEKQGDEPPAKRAKTGGGAFSGFNSFLPAPKRAARTNDATSSGNTKKVGLGSGVNLKTGAAPGFSREPESEREYREEEKLAQTSELGGSGLTLPPPKTASHNDQEPADEVKLIGKPLMFKPLSVSRKLVKKKKQIAVPNATKAIAPSIPSTPEAKAEPSAKRPKVSLFSMSAESEKYPVSTSNGEYKSMIYEPSTGNEGDEAEENSLNIQPSYEDNTPNTSRTAPPAVPTPPVSQSLDDIAGDLNLTESQKRQLFGRQKGGRVQSATKVINFNTDQEYLHNEELRAAGEQVVHNPVRSIAPGKHSLKQLVNAAQSQKDALEESFAKGKSNRAEASSRYGW
ncbi:hypothetical protein BDZ45DRAFT_810639 [Acephala macrosclerotiorum]|nr:hypothetical protein BDZ45DRAFT_810639 [Acephala macrosclerotiorum]